MIDPDSLQPWDWYRGFEGGAVYLAERKNKFYVITDERTLMGLLPDEDLGTLVKVQEFDSREARDEFALTRYGERDALSYPEE